MLRRCVVASAVSFCVSFTLQAQPTALRQPAKAAISTVQATHALFTAAAAGDRIDAINLLAAGADPRAKNDDGKLPFQIAMDADHNALTAILLRAAHGIDARDEQGWTPLNWAILSDDWQLVRALIREGADIVAGHQNALVVAKMVESEMQLLEIVIAEQGVDAKFGWQDETLMILAVQAGLTKIVAMLLDGGADPNTDNSSALLLAAREGHTEIVAMLLAKGADLHAKDWLGNSALLLAARGGHTEIVAMLIDGGADLNVKGGWGKASALLLAARRGHTEIVVMLINGGADLNARSAALDIAERYRHKEIAAILRTAMQTPAEREATLALFTAAAVGDRAAAVRWLAAGADATAINEDGKRPFQVAMDAEHDALTAILLEAAGGIDARDEQGWSPLNWAILSGDWQLVRELIREGADISVGHQNALVVAELMESEMQLLEIIIAEQGVDAKFGKSEETLMMLAARGGHTETVELLLEGGANLNAKDGWGDSAIMLAARYGHTEIVKILIDNGADLHTTSTSGDNALTLAAKNGNAKVVEILITYGVDVNSKYRTYSAIMLAARYGHTDIVKLLIDGGADFNARSAALDIAERFRRKEIAAILRAAEQAEAEGKR